MRKLFSLFLALVATTSLWAHDFEVDGIYYNYLDGNNVEVTYRGKYNGSFNEEYDGAVTIPASVTYNGTTYSVTSIGEWAFNNCPSLTSVTIGNSVTSIGDWTFAGCYSLTSITCLGTTPPDASDLGAPTNTCTLIVPQSAYNAYVRHAYWGLFLNIVPSSEMESSAPEIYVNPANPAQKLLRNGQVYILKDDKTYTIMGAQIQ